jgi:hypothetical protein
MADFKKLKVAELKALCTEKGLSTTGKKDDLIARLAEVSPAHCVSCHLLSI